MGVTNRDCSAFCRRGILGPFWHIPVGSPLPGLFLLLCSAPCAQVMRGPVTSGSSPRHARRSGVARRAGRIAEPAPVRVLADGDSDRAQRAARFDPLSHPVAITGHCVIGDQIRVPAAWCAMTGCQAAFADPAALGEADNRARAVAAGWVKDALGRLACPACQRDHPVPAWWVPCPEPGTVGDHGPAGGPAPPAGGTSRSGRPAVWGPPAADRGRHHQRLWPRLLSVLAGGHPQGDNPQRHRRAGGRHSGRGQTPSPARSLLPALRRKRKARQLLPATEPSGLARAETRGNSHVRFLGGGTQQCVRPTRPDRVERRRPGRTFAVVRRVGAR